jgi:hypothetical protein
MKYKVYYQYSGSLGKHNNKKYNTIGEAKGSIRPDYPHHDILILRCNPYVQNVASILPSLGDKWIDFFIREDITI